MVPWPQLLRAAGGGAYASLDRHGQSEPERTARRLENRLVSTDSAWALLVVARHEWRMRTPLVRRWSERPVTPLRILAKWVVGGLAVGLFVGLQGLLFGNYTINQVLLIVAAPVAACLVVCSVVAVLHGEKPAYVQSPAQPPAPKSTSGRRKVLFLLSVLFVFVLVEIASYVRQSGRSTLLYVWLMGLVTVIFIAEFILERRGRHRRKDVPG